MPSKWEGVPINKVPSDERECEKTRREDEVNRKKQAESEASPNVIAKVRSPMDAITNLNAPSIFSKGIHSGMMGKSGAQRVNKMRVPDSPMGTQMVAKQDRDRPMPIPRSNQSKQDERLSKELNAARKQIELDEQDKEALRETIEKQKKMIAELEKRPLLTDEMIADLVTLRRRKEGEARRNAEYNKRHGYA